MASGNITLWQIDGETMETVRDFIWGGGSRITADGECSHKKEKNEIISFEEKWMDLDYHIYGK